jgi:hypothetical protein
VSFTRKRVIFTRQMYSCRCWFFLFGLGTLFITVQDLLELKNIILEVELSNELINVNENVLEHQTYKHISEVPSLRIMEHSFIYILHQ